MELTSSDFQEGSEIPKKFGYKHGNETPQIIFLSGSPAKCSNSFLTILGTMNDKVPISVSIESIFFIL